MALPLEQFVKQLEDSGIIAAETLKDFIPPKASPKSAEDLARELVLKKKLTKFQASEAYQGKAKSLVLGNYVILEKIGAGGMGQVFKARHRRMERMVAIKMLPPAMTRDVAALARFQREVVAAAKLRHPNIVAADDADEARGVHFLVMEYVEGRDLSALVKRDGPFPVDKAVNYILQAARGLEFAHGEGVIHRDIKPSNLLLDLKGTVKILDMGLARIEAGGDAEIQAELTGTGMVMGTVDYMAPEQGMSTKNADARADIYSLGCALHYLLIGKAIYSAETVMAKMVAHLQEPIPDLCQLRGEVPLQVDVVFQKMVAKKIGDRYQTMTEVVADLERCGIGRDVSFSSQQSLGFDADDGVLTFLREIPVQTTHKPRAAKAAGQGGVKNRKPVLIGAGVLGVVVLLAGVVFMFKTKDGTLIVEVNQPDAVVQVLSEEGKVEISEPGGPKPISISVVPGKHRIRVEKDGFVAITDDIEIAPGGTLDIKARLVPRAAAAVATADAKNRPLAFNDPAFQQWMKTVATLTAAKQVEAVTKMLMELNPGFDGNVTSNFEGRVATGLSFVTDNVTDISPVRALKGLDVLRCSGSNSGKGKLSDLTPLKGMKLARLSCHYTQVSDLSPLQEVPLTFLNCGTTVLSDLSPLRGMSLKSLWINGTNVSDLSPLKGMPLTSLHCAGSVQVNNLLPLRGMPLTEIDCHLTPVSDLSPLEGMNVTELSFTPKSITRGLDIIRQMKSLKVIGFDEVNKWPPAEFWKKYDAGEFGKRINTFNDPAFQQWMKTVAPLPAEKQVEAVSKKLMELNPGFDGKAADYYGKGTPKIENGVVTELSFLADNVTDISPVRALVELKSLICSGSSTSKGKLSDLSPLHGMQLLRLKFGFTHVSDLSPLQGMPLTDLVCHSTPVSDLSPLRGMPLTSFSCNGNTLVSDLSPLAGMKLTGLNLGGVTKVSDLSPLKGMPLTNLTLDATQVSDLSPLKGMPLTTLRCSVTPVSDLSPLRGMPLQLLLCSGTKVSDISPLEGCQSLKTLDVKSTKITAASVAALQKALPNCKIEWDDPAKPKTPEPAASGTK